MQAVTRVNAEQASKILMRKPTFGTEGRLPSLDVMTSEEPASDSAGVVATACMHTETWRNTGSLGGGGV
jgi:hypothetical protein